MGVVYTPMPRLLIAFLLLAEINFRCVQTNACEDDDTQRCTNTMDGETEGETEDETEGETGEPMPDLGG